VEIPWLLQIAIDRGWGKFFHDQMKVTFPPRAEIELDYMPPDEDKVWVTFNMTFGNIPEDSILIEHECYAGMKRHLDPSWYSLGIGASFEYPLWIYCTRETPHIMRMTNLTDDYVTADACIWMVEFTRTNFRKFREFIEGVVAFFTLFGKMYETLRYLLIVELFPEVKEELAYVLEPEVRRELRKVGIYLPRRRRRVGV